MMINMFLLQNPDSGVTGHDSDSNGIDWTDVVIVDKPDAGQ